MEHKVNIKHIPPIFSGALIDRDDGGDGDKEVDTDNGGLSGGEIAGIVIGVLLLVTLGGAVAYVMIFGVPSGVDRCWTSVRSSVSKPPSGLPVTPPESYDNPISFSGLQDSSQT